MALAMRERACNKVRFGRSRREAGLILGEWKVPDSKESMRWRRGSCQRNELCG